MPVRDVLQRLREAGMKSLPGAGAEILVERVRKRISARKVKPDEWLGVMREAQLLGMPTTATMMFGSIETAEERIEHMHVVRELQDETGGFTAFIPWYYVPHKTPLRGKEATGLEYLRVLAISRLYLDNVAHLQASWLTPGLKLGQLALFYGCDDMGGTILEERVVHDAGSTNEATRNDLEHLIIDAGYRPVVRDTLLEYSRGHGVSGRLGYGSLDRRRAQHFYSRLRRTTRPIVRASPRVAAVEAHVQRAVVDASDCRDGSAAIADGRQTRAVRPYRIAPGGSR